MRSISVVAGLLLLSTTAFGDSVRTPTHLVKIDMQPAAGSSRQYNVQVFDAESRASVAQLNVVTKGKAATEAEATAGGTRYKVRVEPHGEAYLFDFNADGVEGTESLRAGFTPGGRIKQPPAPSHAKRGGRDIKEPKVLHRVDAAYTEDAKAAGAAGSVVVDVLIDRSGFVREATASKTMGHGLTEAAVDAVSQWQFEPSVDDDGLPVEVTWEVTIEFKP
jgi:TonB family protein